MIRASILKIWDGFVSYEGNNYTRRCTIWKSKIFLTSGMKELSMVSYDIESEQYVNSEMIFS